MAAYKGCWFVGTLCLLVVVFSGTPKEPRTLTTVLNPGCNHTQCTENATGSVANLAYVKAVGSSDILHFVFSTIGVPAVVVIRTNSDPANHLNVNWDKLLSNDTATFKHSISMSHPGNIKYSFAVVFTKLLEYNDTGDDADLNSYPWPNSTARNDRPFTAFDWNMVESLPDNNNSVVFNSTTWMNASDTGLQGDDKRNTTPSLAFTFRSFDDDSRESDLPHLEYNENSTQFDFTLDNFPPSFPESRFALELAVISDNSEKPEAMTMEESKSIDDEYSPGVFRIVDWLTRPNSQTEGGFLQWKPVCYKDTPRARLVATSVKKYPMGDTKNITELLEKSIAYAFYGDSLNKPAVTKNSANISFGLTKDGKYPKTNYTSWSATIGYGTPPQDKVSLLVIGVISAGLGIPILIILFGGVYIGVKKHRNKNARTLQDVSSSYPQVND